MLRNILISVLFCAVVAGGTAMLDSGQFQKSPPAPGRVADFSFTAINGKSGSLNDFEGRVVLVHFWATWCAPCVEEFPALWSMVFDMEQSGQKIAVMAISVDEDVEDIRRFIGTFSKPNMRMPIPDHLYIVHDPDQAITKGLFGIAKFPETLVLGPDLTLRQKMTGGQDWASESLRAQLIAVH